MRVSVIIPVYDGSKYLAAAIDSVLAQTRALDEIIVIDDGSTDSSPEILRSFGDRLQVVRQHNQGVAAARNVGLAHASGDLIGFLDQDDIWPVDRTRLMVEALQAEPEAQLVVGLTQILYERPTPPGQHNNIATQHREFLLGSLCVRAELFKALGPFNTAVGYADDTDFWLRRTEAGTRTIFLDQVTLRYRMHANNTSFDQSVSNFHMMAAIRESLKRRRSRNERKLHNPPV